MQTLLGVIFSSNDTLSILNDVSLTYNFIDVIGQENASGIREIIAFGGTQVNYLLVQIELFQDTWMRTSYRLT